MRGAVRRGRPLAWSRPMPVLRCGCPFRGGNGRQTWQRWTCSWSSGERCRERGDPASLNPSVGLAVGVSALRGGLGSARRTWLTMCKMRRWGALGAVALVGFRRRAEEMPYIVSTGDDGGRGGYLVQVHRPSPMRRLVLLLLLLPCRLGVAHRVGAWTRYVRPFTGTGGTGHTYPGATAPFGLVQLSPDTRIDQSWESAAGYYHADSTALRLLAHAPLRHRHHRLRRCALRALLRRHDHRPGEVPPALPPRHRGRQRRAITPFASTATRRLRARGRASGAASRCGSRRRRAWGCSSTRSTRRTR